MFSEKSFRTIKRLLFVISVIAGMIVLLLFLSTLIFPFIIAWIIALFINPLVNFLQYNGKIPRQFAVFIVLFGFISVLSTIITLLVGELITITDYLSRRAPHHLEEMFITIENFFAHEILPKIQHMIIHFSGYDDQNYSFSTQLSELFTNIISQVVAGIQMLLTKLTGFLSWLPKAFTSLVVTIIATFFISNDWYKLKKTSDRYLPQIVRERTFMVFYNLRRALFGYIRAQFIIIAISTSIVFTGLIILKSDYPFVLALVIGFLDLLPFFGPGIVLVPWMIYEWIIRNHAMALGLLVLFIIIIVTRQLIEPKIISTNIGLNPLLTLLGMFVGWKMIGLVGVILVPVIFVFIQSLHKSGVFSDLWDYIQSE